MRRVASVSAFLLCLAAWQPKGTVADSAPSSSSLPKVELNTASQGPREIEDLTRRKILHDYAAAWKTLAISLEQNRADILNDYFTGTAKKEFSQTITEQASTGIHQHYFDHGHKLEAVFYSPDGGVMQLRDSAEYEVQIFDGARLLHSERTTAKFLVLMTPAADRWMVRLLQNVPTS